jgi:hypothetical protein
MTGEYQKERLSTPGKNMATKKKTDEELSRGEELLK